jgi:hypothetical protein
MKSKRVFIGLGCSFLLTVLSTVSRADTYIGDMHVWRCPMGRADDYQEDRLKAEGVRSGMLSMSSMQWSLGKVHPSATSVHFECRPRSDMGDCVMVPVSTPVGPAVFSVSVAGGSEQIPNPEQIVDIAKAFAKCGKFMAAHPF